MTVEGLVLFQARAGQAVQVERALPPFDRAGFADGILNDIRLMFLEPIDAGVQTGRSGADGDLTCRYSDETGEITDVRPGTASGWRLERYTGRGKLMRVVTAESAGGSAGLPGQMELQAPGPAGYTLRMKLVDAIPIND